MNNFIHTKRMIMEIVLTYKKHLNSLLLLILFFVLVSCSTQDKQKINLNPALPTIYVEDHSGFDREMWPVTGGIPFPKGAVSEVDKIGIKGFPSQTRILSRWSDGSIKWALIDYQAHISANGKTAHQVILSATPSIGGNVLTETDKEIIVDTGVLKFRISKQHFSFLDQVWLDLNKNGTYEPDEQIVKTSSGQDHFLDVQANYPDRPTIPYAIRNLNSGTSRPIKNELPTVKGGSRWIRPEGGGAETRKYASDGLYKAVVVEHGPLRTVIKLKGRLGSANDDSDYTIWIHAYTGKPFIRIQHNFMFRGNPQTTNIRRIGLKLPLAFDTPPKFKASGLTKQVSLIKKDNAYLFNTGPHDVFHLEYKSFPLNWEVKAGNQNITGTEKTGGWIDVSSEKFGVTMSMKDMAYKYPKELSYNANENSLNAWMWPDHGNLVLDLRASGWPYGMQGVSFTHDIFYSFHGPGEENQSEVFAAKADDTPQPYANPEWYSYKGTKAAGMIMPFDDSEFPKTEALLATGTAFIERSMTEFGWLGMLNYGDLMFMYAYHKGNRALGTWGFSRRPDDYDGWRRGNTMISYRMFMQYLRTGEYRYWKAASAHLKFVRDALIKHYNSEDSRFIGYGRRHSAYWGITPRDESDRSGGVAWDGYGSNWLGHYLHWNLTGDWRTYEVIDEIRSSWNIWGNEDIDQLKGGAFVGLKIFGSIPGYERAKNEAENFRASAVDRITKPADIWRDNTYYFGYGLYLQDEDDSNIRQAIMDWWRVDENHQPDDYGYWHRESMAAAYWAAKGNQAARDSIYNKLAKLGSTENQNSSRIESQNVLYKRYGVSGLFECDIVPLANAVTPRYWIVKDGILQAEWNDPKSAKIGIDPGYWRAKDDIMQMQWDEPLGMAVLDHYRENAKAISKSSK